MCDGQSTIPDDGVVCISLFKNSNEYVFNVFLDNDTEIINAERDFNVKNLFPLEYETEFQNEYGDRIVGDI